jgi:hypothetical protein
LPARSFLEGAQPALVPFHRGRETDEAHVDREVGETRRDAGDDREHAAGVALDVEYMQREGADGRQRSE